MSAYVVDEKTINKVITFLDNDQEMRSYLHHQLNLDLDTRDKAQDFGNKLMALNIQAVNERYDEHEPVVSKILRAIGYQFHYELTDRIGAYKALRCLIYQCSEGDVPKTELYHSLEKISDYMAHSIVSSLKVYEERPWG
jgi:hypothetical protein